MILRAQLEGGASKKPGLNNFMMFACIVLPWGDKRAKHFLINDYMLCFTKSNARNLKEHQINMLQKLYSDSLLPLL